MLEEAAGKASSGVRLCPVLWELSWEHSRALLAGWAVLGMQNPSAAFPSQPQLGLVHSPCFLCVGLTKAWLLPLGEHWGSHESHQRCCKVFTEEANALAEERQLFHPDKEIDDQVTGREWWWKIFCIWRPLSNSDKPPVFCAGLLGHRKPFRSAAKANLGPGM